MMRTAFAKIGLLSALIFNRHFLKVKQCLGGRVLGQTAIALDTGYRLNVPNDLLTFQ
jgi:hypothetical protein